MHMKILVTEFPTWDPKLGHYLGFAAQDKKTKQVEFGKSPVEAIGGLVMRSLPIRGGLSVDYKNSLSNSATK
jgi:hypothetical protein